MKKTFLFGVLLLILSNTHASNYTPLWIDEWQLEKDNALLRFSRTFRSKFNKNTNYGIFITYGCTKTERASSFEPSLDIYQIYYHYDDHTYTYDFDEINIFISFPEKSNTKLHGTNLGGKALSKISNADFVNLFPRDNKAIHHFLNSAKYASDFSYQQDINNTDRFNFYIVRLSHNEKSTLLM